MGVEEEMRAKAIRDYTLSREERNDTLRLMGLFAVSSGLAIANLVYSKQYTGLLEEVVKGNASDVTIMLPEYFLWRLLTDNSVGCAAFVFCGASTLEVMQGLGLRNGTFDPYDFIAYGVGVGLALGLDRLTMRSKKGLEERVG